MYSADNGLKHLNILLKRYGIKVAKWSATSSGNANWKTKSIKIPRPTNADRFAVCMHEIKHIIDGDGGTRFEQEFACDMYAREKMIEIGCLASEINDWDKRTNWHVLSRIAMAVNRRYNPNKIPDRIKEWFHFIDFSTWIGKKVFVSMDEKNERGIKIKLVENISKSDIEWMLDRQGLELYKSQIDDSTYGHWMVKPKNSILISDNETEEFENLSEIINHYQLTLQS